MFTSLEAEMTEESLHVCSCLTVYGGRAWNHVDAPAPTAMNTRVVTGHAAPDVSNHARLPAWSIKRPRGDPAWDCSLMNAALVQLVAE